MLLLTRRDVAALLTMPDAIAAMEDAFGALARGSLPAPPGVLATHVAGGGFHVKAAALGDSPGWYAAKVNANFPGNPSHHGLPTIQGALLLFETGTGRPLALLDSMELTILRTAAATALAARYLARPDAATMTLLGCGVQGRAHLRALRVVRPIRRAWLVDSRPGAAEQLAREMAPDVDFELRPTGNLARAMHESEICLTCTTARSPVLGPDEVHPGLFIGAVGADNPEKQELDPDIFAAARVVVDVLEQAATMGDLHHALAAGVLQRAQVHAELGDIVTGSKPGRTDAAQVFVFDSTGMAVQDVAAAVRVYQSARASGAGTEFDLAE